MTTTDEFRALLDIYGIHWERAEFLDTVGRDIATVYRADHAEWIALEDTDENLNPTGNGINVTNYRKPLTPEQVINATLGRETCRLVPTRDKPRSKAPTLTCSECGWWTADIGATWHYCPNCGRKVVE